MALFVVCAAVMVAAALAFVATPLLRHAREAVPRAPARRIHALDEALAAGVIDAEEYAAKRARLDAEPAPPSTAGTPRSRASFVALLLAALLMPAASLLLYRLVGTPEALDAANLAAPVPAHESDRGPEMEKAVATLAQRLKDQPGDVEGWALLGRAYAALNRPTEALDALKHAHELATDNTALTVEYAQALASAAPERRIDGEAKHLLEDVLNAEPNNQRALWLLGISDYQAARYDAAVARWKSLLPLLPPNSDVEQSVRKQIARAEAARDGKAPPDDDTGAASGDRAGRVARNDSSSTNPSPPSAADASGPRLTVNVKLDPKLDAALDPNATLFVFARAAQGPPMPLAIQRLKAAQLPITVTLDESMGMLPTMKLSAFAQVIVGARVSKSGNALPQSGDLQTLSAPLDVHRSEPVELLIDQTVP